VVDSSRLFSLVDGWIKPVWSNHGGYLLLVESTAVDLWLIQAAFSLVHGWIKPAWLIQFAVSTFIWLNQPQLICGWFKPPFV
jgi:hypothetical protein